MDGIRQIAGPVRPARRQPVGGRGGFLVSTGTAESTAATTGMAASDLTGLLTLQEHDPEDRRNRDASRRCSDLLKALAELQRSLLGGPDGPESLAQLAALVGTVPDAANPQLAVLARMIALRARVEIARREQPNVKIARNDRKIAT